MSAQDSSIYHVATSSDLPAHERYEHWLTPLLSDFEAAVPNAWQRQDFQARVSSLVTATSELHDMQSDDFSGSRSRQRIRHHENDKLALVYVREGQIIGRYDGDTEIIATVGQFVLFDAQQPNEMHFCQQPHFVQVNLPRGKLASVLAGKPLPSKVSRAVTRSGLAPLLATQLNQFADISQKLSFHEQLALLRSTEALATHVVESACLDSWQYTNQHYEGLYAAAQLYIHLHLSDATLSSTSLAGALGCSRATLYRVFAAQGLGVAEHIRDLRLRKAYCLLQNTAAGHTIADIAAHCGFIDHASFSRLFRQRFGDRPSDIRQ